MNNANSALPVANDGEYQVEQGGAASHLEAHSPDVKRVLRNTYALLAMTLLFSAGVAVGTRTLQLPAPGLVVTLAGYFGLLYAVFKLQNSVWPCLSMALAQIDWLTRPTTTSML